MLGDVVLHADSSVWYQAVLRGDINRIEIGARSNIQDGCILHVENELPCRVGADVTVGHRAVLHGCTVEDGCLIGIGAVVLSGAVIPRGSVVASGAVVLEHARFEPGVLLAGVPAKPVKQLGADVYETHLKWARKYVNLAVLYKQGRLI